MQTVEWKESGAAVRRCSDQYAAAFCFDQDNRLPRRNRNTIQKSQPLFAVCLGLNSAFEPIDKPQENLATFLYCLSKLLSIESDHF